MVVGPLTAYTLQHDIFYNLSCLLLDQLLREVLRKPTYRQNRCIRWSGGSQFNSMSARTVPRSRSGKYRATSRIDVATTHDPVVGVDRRLFVLVGIITHV